MDILKKRCERAQRQGHGFQKTVIWMIGALPAGILFLTIACSSNETTVSTTVPPTDRSSIAPSVAAPTATQIPAIQPSPTSVPEPTNRPLPTVEPLLSITAVELYGEREANATRYDVQYKGKKVRISGLVGKIDGGQISLVVDHATFNLLDTTFLESIELHDLPINDQIKANKGEGFEAVCTVGDYILGSIQLRDCADGEAVELAAETVLGETASRKTASSTAGTLIVGQDIQPGRYKAEVVDGLVPICYWARLSETDGELSSIIANNTAMEGSVYVTIKPDDFAFESRGCTDWQLQNDIEAVADNELKETQVATATPHVTPTPLNAPTSTVEDAPTTTPTTIATPKVGVTVSPTVEPLQTNVGLGPGAYLVGSDVQPGRYKAEVASGSFGCSWSRLSDTDGEFSSIIAIALITEGQTYVTIKESDYAFETSGCTDFVDYSENSSQADPALQQMGPGTYLVGSEIRPGLYRAQVAPGSFGCSWSRLSETDGEFSSLIAIDLIVEGQTYVTIEETDFAFETSGCTNWEQQQ